MGRASPPPHLDKIQKNSSFFREPFPTFQHAVEKCHHIRSWRDSSWEPSSPPPHYEWASWWTRGRALSRGSRESRSSPRTSLLRPSFSDKKLHLHGKINECLITFEKQLKEKSKSYPAATCRMLPTRLATAECSRRGWVSDGLGSSALTLPANLYRVEEHIVTVSVGLGFMNSSRKVVFYCWFEPLSMTYLIVVMFPK